MHACRKWGQLTTAAIWLGLAACSNSRASRGDAGCSTQACSQPNNCPVITCLCVTGVNIPDASSTGTETRTIQECTDGCCAPCPTGCTQSS